VIHIIKDEKGEILFMLKLLLDNHKINDAEYRKSVEKLNNTYK